MTFSRFLVATVIAAGLGLSQSASADTYVAYHCHCTAEPGHSCSCSYSFQLGKSQTKEFRGYCEETTASDGGRVWPDIDVTDRDSATSCTIQARGPLQDYETKSCTNWSPFSRDNVTIKTTCEQAVPSDF